jgi:hypothetical protein
VSHGEHTTRQYLALVLISVVTAVLVAYSFADRPEQDRSGSVAEPDPSSAAAPGPAECLPPTRLAVLGDSTRDADAEGKAYVKELRGLLPDTEVRSFAVDTPSVDDYMTDPVQRKVDKWAPDAVELSIGVSDLSRDQSAKRVARLRAELGSFVDGLQVRFGDVPMVATVPAALSTRDVDGSGYIKPPEAAAEVTHQVRSVYLDVQSRRPWLRVVDAQLEVTGTEADPAEKPTYLSDQVHPNAETAAKIAALVAAQVGCSA